MKTAYFVRRPRVLGDLLVPHPVEAEREYEVAARVSTQAAAEAITALTGCGIQQRLAVLRGVRRAAVLDKLFAADGTVAFAQPPAAVLDISGSAAVTEVKLLAGKAVVKGQIQALCAWKSRDSAALQSQEAAIPFEQILDVEGLTEDSQGRFVLTIRELLGTWAENAAAFTPGETVVGIVRSVEDYGTFVEIAPNLAGLAESCPDLRPGQAVSVYIKSILPEKMKIKLVIVNRALGQSHRFDLHYFLTEGHIDRWVYSTPESKKQIVTEFAAPACNRA